MPPLAPHQYIDLHYCFVSLCALGRGDYLLMSLLVGYRAPLLPSPARDSNACLENVEEQFNN